ncbi:hypothetical protein D3C85_1673410 [compost metagenome]
MSIVWKIESAGMPGILLIFIAVIQMCVAKSKRDMQNQPRHRDGSDEKHLVKFTVLAEMRVVTIPENNGDQCCRTNNNQ